MLVAGKFSMVPEHQLVAALVKWKQQSRVACNLKLDPAVVSGYMRKKTTG